MGLGYLWLLGLVWGYEKPPSWLLGGLPVLGSVLADSCHTPQPPNFVQSALAFVAD